MYKRAKSTRGLMAGLDNSNANNTLINLNIESSGLSPQLSPLQLSTGKYDKGTHGHILN